VSVRVSKRRAGTQVAIAAILIAPIVENAILHNLMRRNFKYQI
jgi:LytS/YehU family sensor histidine kinase